jgi:hypothetical protein
VAVNVTRVEVIMWCDTNEREFTFYPWGFTHSFVTVRAKSEAEAKRVADDFVYNGIPSGMIVAYG